MEKKNELSRNTFSRSYSPIITEKSVLEDYFLSNSSQLDSSHELVTNSSLPSKGFLK